LYFQMGQDFLGQNLRNPSVGFNGPARHVGAEEEARMGQDAAHGFLVPGLGVFDGQGIQAGSLQEVAIKGED
jgi:hypothetical protein